MKKLSLATKEKLQDTAAYIVLIIMPLILIFTLVAWGVHWPGLGFLMLFAIIFLFWGAKENDDQY
jgi:hypothetical protein